MNKNLMTNYPNTHCQFKDGKPLYIRVRYKSGKISYNMVFKDSLKLLPMKLNTLIEEYRVKTKKLFLPYGFISLDNLNYNGKLPDKKYYVDISDDDYQTLVNEFKDNN
jgi:hypothetical protein